AHAAAPEPSEPAAPMGAHAAESGSAAQEDILGLEDTGPLPEPEVVAAAAEAARKASPEDTAEIDVAQVEAQLKDPGTTQSFAPLTEERIPTDSTYDAGTTTSLMWGARSDVGCVRSHNEDSYLVASPLFAVCDGMGGHAAGEVASSIAVETIARTSPGTADAAQLAAAVEAANAAVIEAAASGIGRPGMGCTATVAYIEGTTIAIAHVGDSRAYLLHEGVLTRVTRDHSYVEELVDAGEITADEARVHPNRSVITRALGSDPGMYADHFTLNIVEGDRLILCSDGLSSMISDSEIEDIAVKSSTAQMCTDNLVDAALAAGGADNVSVVVVDVVDDGRLKQVVRTHRRNIAIALGALVALVLAAAIALFVVISNSVYLGVDGDTVAVYQGIPATVLGVELHHVQEETSIKLSDLPEDTQNRLREGIAQGSLEQARDTISDYRRQIDEARSQQAATAEAIRESATSQDQAGTDAASGAGTDPAADAAATGETADPAAADPAAAGAAQTQNPEGGA
ncbi:Stp1/IreP family PP2C-type Ser/Thr phosphatase, partial [Candidatus Collinsella stercoripullorum]|uniref:Stp1/IreP family PP2C-type Ser/Thr phosphatase n=1 Tax=Candidatus Collinsella stercoripullorum TaxID=2838522 RepID=UPI0022E135D3